MSLSSFLFFISGRKMAGRAITDPTADRTDPGTDRWRQAAGGRSTQRDAERPPAGHMTSSIINAAKPQPVNLPSARHEAFDIRSLHHLPHQHLRKLSVDIAIPPLIER
jgi:hypothetical protein